MFKGDTLVAWLNFSVSVYIQTQRDIEGDLHPPGQI